MMKNYDENKKEFLKYEGEDRERFETLEVLWSRGKDGVCIHRIYGDALSVKVPATIGGMPVTEIGAYCFSDSERYPSSGCQLSLLRSGDDIMADFSGNQWEERKESTELTEAIEHRELAERKEPAMPAICGRYVEEIELPDTVWAIGNSAFYNCRNLKRISLGTALDSMGSDVFMNCIHLKEIIIRGDSEAKTGLDIILERIQTEVEVWFEIRKDVYDSVLLFTEYYEWLDEINAAHIFNRRIEGGGFRMRQCFQNRSLQYNKYDQHFPSIIPRESAAVVCKIALNRLRWPKGLQADARDMYREAVEDRMMDAVRLSVQERDLTLLEYICSSFSPDDRILSQGMELCIKADWGEGNVFLMEKKSGGRSFAEKSYDFDDFEEW